MPIYHLTQKTGTVNVIVEAKSESAARLHLVCDVKAKLINVAELAALVLDGVLIERAKNDAELPL